MDEEKPTTLQVVVEKNKVKDTSKGNEKVHSTLTSSLN